MSSHTSPVACPNCHVSDQTGVAVQNVNSDEDGVSDVTHCSLCNYLSLTSKSTDRSYARRQFGGDVVSIDDVVVRARAWMLEDGWTDEDIEDNVESWIDPEWLEWYGSDEQKSLAAGKARAV